MDYLLYFVFSWLHHHLLYPCISYDYFLQVCCTGTGAVVKVDVIVLFLSIRKSTDFVDSRELHIVSLWLY